MNKGLRKKLLAMASRDQKMRKSGNWNARVDKSNTAHLRRIVKHYGWPDRRLVGKKGAEAAWLIAQHTDHDVRFQEKCLKIMTDLTAIDSVSSIHIAYLTDRVRVHRKKKQLFGTQFHRTNQGKLIPWPIENKKYLNSRRKKIGLEPFEKYKAQLLRIHARMTKK